MYLCEDRLGQQVAIKIFRVRDQALAGQATSASTDPAQSMRDRFISEARTLRTLSGNAHIVDMYHFDELDDGTPYYVMPYLPRSLIDEIGKDAFSVGALEDLPQALHPRRLPVIRSLQILSQILEALSSVHQAGLVHRDIKPANILLNEQGQVQVCDFGIAKLPDTEHSQSGVGMGSRNYMSPEQRESAKHITAQADIYAVGTLAYRMLTGTLPVGQFNDPKDYAPQLGDELNTLLLKAIDQHPQERPKDASEMLRQLKRGIKLLNQTGPQEKDDDNTDTDVSGSIPGLRDELKPLRQRIETLLLDKGEVSSANREALTVPAVIVDLDEAGLDALIQQVTQTHQAKLKPIQNYLQLIDRRLQEQQGRLNQNTRKVLLEAGQSLGWPEGKIERVISEREAAYSISNKKGSNKQPANQQEPATGYRWLWVTLVLLILLVGVGITEYTARQDAAIAQLAQEDAQGKAEADAKAQAKDVQDYLNRLGYQIPASGSLDARTQAGIERFEQDQGLLKIGAIDTVLIRNLEKVFTEKDKAAWQKAKQQHTAQSYQSYQQAFPKGQYVAQVATKQKEAIKDADDADKAAWQKALAANTEPSYRGYQKEWPKGLYIGEVSGKVAAARQARELAAAKRKTEIAIKDADEAAWQKALAANTEPSYQAYQRRWPKGLYTSEVPAKIAAARKAETARMAATRPDNAFSDCTGCPDMVVVPSGRFQMGINGFFHDEKPVHRVTIRKAFAVGVYEVTFAQWDQCKQEGGCSHHPEDYWGSGNRPVVDVSWDDTQEYVAWLSNKTGKTYRLPSESEWEYMARAGSTTKYTWGNSLSCSQARYNGCGSETVPVGSFQANAFGLYDVHGNVQEWVQDCYNDSYRGAPSDGRARTSCDTESRVLRGGSLYAPPVLLRSANRLRYSASSRSGDSVNNGVMNNGVRS